MTPDDRDKLLEAFLRRQAEADTEGSIRRIEEGQDRLYNLFLRQEEEHRSMANELRGDIRGVSLRVGAVEREVAGVLPRLVNLEKRDDRHEEQLSASQSWIIGDLDKKKAKAESFVQSLKDPRTIVAIVAGLWAAGTTLWHFLHP